MKKNRIMESDDLVGFGFGFGAFVGVSCLVVSALLVEYLFSGMFLGLLVVLLCLNDWHHNNLVDEHGGVDSFYESVFEGKK